MEGLLECNARRPPLDPPGDHSGDTFTFNSRFRMRRPMSAISNPNEEVLEPTNKRQRTMNDVLGSLSIHPPDPPGNVYPGAQGRYGADRNDHNNFSLHGKNNISPSSYPMQPPLCFSEQYPPKQAFTSDAADSAKKLDYESPQLPDFGSLVESIKECKQNPHTSNAKNLDNNRMSIEDSDYDSDGSSVSESSIRDAMYQLVFGRGKTRLFSDQAGYSHYDFVDSKIEDLIRKSRMEAEIKSKRENKDPPTGEDNNMDVSV
mmetsp:Transcript_26934/g.55557  ORF Transcript_26934/g.55557 Transcript_26934/m.55557 type:complete len:260 (-) Transcript_26934:310-1089(-)